MARRKTLIGISILGHAALFTGVLVHSAWDVEKLDYKSRSSITLAALPPPASEGASMDLPRPKEMARKMKPVKETVQPRKRPDDLKIVIEQPDHGGGQTAGPGTDGPPGVTDGPCKPEDGNCSTAPLPPVPPAPPALPPAPEPPKPTLVAPQILKGLRISGDVAIHPPRDVYNQMFRDKELKTSGILKVCITKTGAIASVAVAKSTGYPAYDDALVDAARRWVYKPYSVGGTPMPACSTVTFMYQMQ